MFASQECHELCTVITGGSGSVILGFFLSPLLLFVEELLQVPWRGVHYLICVSLCPLLLFLVPMDLDVKVKATLLGACFLIVS